MLKKLGPQERIFDELKLISDTAFQFASEESAVDNVEDICESMQFYPPTDFITGSDIFYEYNENVSMVNFSKYSITEHTFLTLTSNDRDTYDFPMETQQ